MRKEDLWCQQVDKCLDIADRLLEPRARRQQRAAARAVKYEAERLRWVAEVAPWLGHPYVAGVRAIAYNDDARYYRRMLRAAITKAQAHPDWSPAQWAHELRTYDRTRTRQQRWRDRPTIPYGGVKETKP